MFYYVRRLQDADTMVNTTDMPFRFYPCMVAGLAYYLSVKKAPERVQLLKSMYEEEFQRAAAEDEDRGPLPIENGRDTERWKAMGAVGNRLLRHAVFGDCLVEELDDLPDSVLGFLRHRSSRWGGRRVISPPAMLSRQMP